MFRIFYNADTGEIERLVTAEFADPTYALPYIDIPDQIRIDSWRVNPTTKELYAVTPPEYPKRGG